VKRVDTEIAIKQHGLETLHCLRTTQTFTQLALMSADINRQIHSYEPLFMIKTYQFTTKCKKKFAPPPRSGSPWGAKILKGVKIITYQSSSCWDQLIWMTQSLQCKIRQWQC